MKIWRTIRVATQCGFILVSSGYAWRAFIDGEWTRFATFVVAALLWAGIAVKELNDADQRHS